MTADDTWSQSDGWRLGAPEGPTGPSDLRRPSLSRSPKRAQAAVGGTLLDALVAGTREPDERITGTDRRDRKYGL